jgi:glycosyltransferase involved in cell wall biosynthesis
MASGRPQVACAVGDVPRFFAAHTVGIAADAEPEAFGGALAKLLNDPAECERIGKAARRHAEEDLQWPVLLERAAEDGEFGWLLRGG